MKQSLPPLEGVIIIIIKVHFQPLFFRVPTTLLAHCTVNGLQAKNVAPRMQLPMRPVVEKFRHGKK